MRRVFNDPTKAALLAQKSRWRLRSRKNYLQGYVLRGIGRFADDGLLREWSAQVNFHPVLDDWRPYCTRDHGVGAVGRGVGRVAGAPSARGARIWLLANMLAYPECDRLCLLHEDCRAALTELPGEDVIDFVHRQELSIACAQRDLERMLAWEKSA